MVLAGAFHWALISIMKIEKPNLKSSAEFDDTEDARKAAVLRLYNECLNGGKFEAADQLISPGFIVLGPDGGAGPEGFKANALRLRAGFPDVHFTVHDLIAENECVALYWTWEGTHRGSFANVPPTGRRVRQEGMVIYRFEAGKIVEARLVFDRLGVFQPAKNRPQPDQDYEIAT
jgi:predicted ester cyclase